MSLPLGFHYERESLLANIFCKVHKRFMVSSKPYANKGFKQSTVDISLFTKITSISFLMLLVYANVNIIASNNQQEVNELQGFFNGCSKLKDLRPLKYFLGFEVPRSPKGISLTQDRDFLMILPCIYE